MTDPRYLAARAICRRHARSFYTASFFLPPQKRYAAYAVYAFCRLLDDATDLAADAYTAEIAIARFERILDDVYCSSTAVPGKSDEASLALSAFAETVRRYAIPKRYFLELAEGCRMDLTISRYATWEALQLYCYRVAGVVGLIMCGVFELRNRSAERHAVTMGNAMQLTNILRDVAEDLQRGRVYLPKEDLDRFGVTEADLQAGRVSPSFVRLMQFEIARASEMFRAASVGLCALPADGSRGTAAAMAVIYSGILSAIEARGCDVFTGRAALSLPQKLARLPRAAGLLEGMDPADVF